MRPVMVLIGNLLRLVLAPLWWVWRSRRGRGGWVRLRVERRLLPVQPRIGRLQRMLRRNLPGGTTSLWRVGELTRAIADDRSTDGLLLLLPNLQAGWAACQTLRDHIGALVGAGKQVVVYLPEGGGQRELFVASAASRIVVTPAAQLQVLGVASQTPYLRPLLDRLGVEPQVQAVGDYKTAGEQLARAEMSAHQREQLTAILASVHDRVVDGLAERPGLDADAVVKLFDRGIFHAEGAVAAGLLDAASYEEQLLEQTCGKAPPAAAGPYLGVRQARMWRSLRRPPYVAIVPILGTISIDGGPFGRGTTLEHTLARLRAVAKDRTAVAVLLLVDSPGGSALASDIIHHEVERLARDKPVVAHFGEVAASGGYYIAAAAKRIVAQPQTVTGSIGVVSGKVVASELLQRQGVSLQTVGTAPHADMFGLGRPWTEEERAMLSEELAVIYARFLEVVARGRQRPIEEVERWASGRVWSGRDALRLGLVDALGGIDEAMDEVRALLPQLGQHARARLQPVWAQAPQGPAPPPELRAASADDGAAGPHAQLAALRNLLSSGERALCYAADLPRIS